MIIVSKRLVQIITFNFASAIALYPFILLSDKCLLEDKHTIFHEKNTFETADRVTDSYFLSHICFGISHL
jgi:hypothetical protein